MNLSHLWNHHPITRRLGLAGLYSGIVFTILLVVPALFFPLLLSQSGFEIFFPLVAPGPIFGLMLAFAFRPLVSHLRGWWRVPLWSVVVAAIGVAATFAFMTALMQGFGGGDTLTGREITLIFSGLALLGALGVSLATKLLFGISIIIKHLALGTLGITILTLAAYVLSGLSSELSIIASSVVIIWQLSTGLLLGYFVDRGKTIV